MTDIRFYHLQKQTLDQALPLIIEKAFSAGYKIITRLSSSQEVERMNALLWNYKANAFLPHGSQKNGNASKQPIWLTAENDNPNNANVLVLTQGMLEENMSNYDLCCEMLDGHDDNAIKEARSRWKTYQEAGHNVTYWHQSESGSWEKKA